ncbi:MAG: hypothetical protein IKC58_01575 [Clostridia bacterium]|nr:hypothetical protein [Clostridia bacterium]MBR2985276.1 hypothetical protein [Clostridia bacterium]
MRRTPLKEAIDNITEHEYFSAGINVLKWLLIILVVVFVFRKLSGKRRRR